MPNTNQAASSVTKLALSIILLAVVLIGSGLGGCSAYNSVRVWSATSAGKAELAQAEQNRQIATLVAKQKMESAKFEAQAEIERAKGVAQANDIIMNRLGGPKNYLAWKQIEALETTKAQLIYVPTESGLPITEAGRLGGLTAPAAE